MYFRHKWDRSCVLALVQKYIHRFVCVTGGKHRMEELLDGTLAFLLLPFVLFRKVILLPMPRWQCQNQISLLGSLPTSYPTQLVRSDLGISFSTQLFIKGLLRKPPTGLMLPPCPLWVASWLADCRGFGTSLLLCWMVVVGVLPAFEAGLLIADFLQAFVFEAKASKASNI